MLVVERDEACVSRFQRPCRVDEIRWLRGRAANGEDAREWGVRTLETVAGKCLRRMSPTIIFTVAVLRSAFAPVLG